jgi:hypothetical protein
MPIYPYSFQLPPLNVQDIPNNGAVGEFLGISAGGVLDWLPVASGGGDLLAANNLSELTATAGTARTNLGLGTGDSPTFKNLTISTGSITTSAPVTISQTWNALAVAFTAFKVNATSTNSAAGSLLLDLQVGGASVFKVSKAGEVTSGFISTFGVNALNLQYGATGSINAFTNFNLGTSNSLVFSDVFLQRDGAANTLALRNSTAAQTFRVYNTFPGTGNNEYAEIAWVGNFLLIRPAASGTATVRGSVFGSGSSETYLDGSVTNFRSTSLIRWSINSSGHFVAGADDTYDIGTLTTNRPRAIYTSRYFYAGTDAGFAVASKAVINSPSDGVIKLNNWAINDFNRLQFGGTTSSFPALKRSTTYLQARLADDSAFAPIQGKLTTDTAFTSGAITDTGYIVLYDSTGTAYKVACTPV